MLQLLLALIFLRPALADSTSPDLTQQTSVPISRLFSITLRNAYVPSIWQSAAHTNITELRPLIPFDIGKQLNIMRITVPYRTNWPTGNGVGDVRIFDLISFPGQQGLWGIGPVVNLRPNIPAGSDTFQGGFVFAFVVLIKPWSFGVLNQNLFSDRVTASTIQPVLTYQFSEHWTIGLGELPFVFDWRSLSRIFVPIGFQLGVDVGPKNDPLRLFVNPQYNTRNIQGAPQWTIITGITLGVHLFTGSADVIK